MAHIHEKIDFTLSIFIVQKDRVLLHVHKKLGIWLPPGGHIELDEDPNQAALREAQEETGLDIELVDDAPENFHNVFESQELIRPRFLQKHFYDVSHAHQHIDLVYFARVKGGEVRPEEGAGDIRWFSKQEIDTMPDLLADVRKYALTALSELTNS